MLKKILLALIILLLPLNAAAKSRDVTIDGDHGQLSAVIQTPDGLQKFPLVILCHGFNADKDYPLMKILADDLESAGIASIRFDFNGHGQSEGDFQAMTIPNEISDAKKIFDFAKKIPNVTNIGATGHSQGSIVAGMLAGELGAKKIRAVVLFSLTDKVRDDVLCGELFGVKFDALNPPEYIELPTPDGTCRVGREYIVTLQNLSVYETAAKFTGAALMIQGTDDTLAPNVCDLRKKFFRRGEIELVERADHAFTGKEQAAAQIATKFFVRHLKK